MKKPNKNKKTFYKILSFILIVVTTFLVSTILYFGVLPDKYLISGIFFLGIIVLFLSYKLNKKTNLFTKIISSLFAMIIILIEVVGIFYAFGTLDFLNNIFDTGYRSETYNIYVLKESKHGNIKDLNKKTISFYKMDSEIYLKALVKLDKIISYNEILVESVGDGVDNVITKESEALFLSESLMQIYKEENKDKYNQLKIIDSINVIVKSDKKFSGVNVTNKPFIVYLSGSDSYGSIQKASRSDVNLLAVVNPKKGKILLINTPRDYYINLPSKKAKDKLTHAGIYGIEESALALSELYDIEINYYGRVNFTSFVKIINSLNGINVDSKHSFSYDGHSFRKGINELTGAEALAFSRARKMLPAGDRSRGENQQAVVLGLINKLSDKTVLLKYSSILKSLESGVMTNVDKNTITKLVNLQINKNIKWDIETYNAEGTDKYRTTYSTGSLEVYVMEPIAETVSEAKIKIKNVVDN